MISEEDMKNIKTQIDSADTIAIISIQKDGMRISRFIPGKEGNLNQVIGGLEIMKAQLVEQKLKNSKE